MEKNMPIAQHRINDLFRKVSVILSLSLVSSLSMALVPSENNFVAGMDVKGQRLNLYRGCVEYEVTCNNMLLVAPDIARWSRDYKSNKRQDTTAYAVKSYSTSTMNSMCADGVTPCRFLGYSFKDNHINGFIDVTNSEIQITNRRDGSKVTLPYKDSSVYLPLPSQADLINTLYVDSDKALNISYTETFKDVSTMYGQDNAGALKKEQLAWVIKRSKDCGANNKHLARTQSEKACFIQKNSARMDEYFLWVD